MEVLEEHQVDDDLVVLPDRAQSISHYIASAQHYCAQVMAQEIPACKWTRQAVERQVEDLQRDVDASWPWIWSEDHATRPCEFIELLPHIKGKWARDRLLVTLEPWQCFVLTTSTIKSLRPISHSQPKICNSFCVSFMHSSIVAETSSIVTGASIAPI